MYFGPPSQARTYFEGLGYKPLPRQSTPDYLTGCTDPNERQFAPGRSEDDVPTTPEQLETAFSQSSFSQDMLVSLEKFKIEMEHDKADQEAFRAAVAAEKKRGVSKRSPYTQGFLNQVRALFLRQFQMRLQDRFQIYTSFTLHTVGSPLYSAHRCYMSDDVFKVLAFVIGGAYFDLKPDAAGAFTRGGVIFSAMLTAALDTFGEVRAVRIMLAAAFSCDPRRCPCKCLAAPLSRSRPATACTAQRRSPSRIRWQTCRSLQSGY